MGGMLERQMSNVGVSGVREDKEVQATESRAHRTHATLASTDARWCERGVGGLWNPLSLLDLTCSLCHIPPRRACPCETGSATESATESASACAAAINFIDDMTLSLMKAGFTVSPRPRRVLAVACTRSKCVCTRACTKGSGRC